jgi:hypothetical protein
MLSKMSIKATPMAQDSSICSPSSRYVSVLGAWINKTHRKQDPDPNGGYVDYVDEEAAFGAYALASINQYGQAFMGVDHKTYYNGTNAVGRPAIRIQSNKLYNGGLFIADVVHMPGKFRGPLNIGAALTYN